MSMLHDREPTRLGMPFLRLHASQARGVRRVSGRDVAANAWAAVVGSFVAGSMRLNSWDSRKESRKG
jgi:hypothetical protein